MIDIHDTLATSINEKVEKAKNLTSIAFRNFFLKFLFACVIFLRKIYLKKVRRSLQFLKNQRLIL